MATNTVALKTRPQDEVGRILGARTSSQAAIIAQSLATPTRAGRTKSTSSTGPG